MSRTVIPLLPDTPDRSPPLIPDRADRSLAQLLAIVLALGGGFWGLFLLFALGPSVLIPLPFGVGYALTAAYLCRALRLPSLHARRRIWLASLIVQGGWLALVGLPMLASGGMNPFSMWWLFATGCSLVGLKSEPRDQPAVYFATKPDPITSSVAPQS